MQAAEISLCIVRIQDNLTIIRVFSAHAIYLVIWHPHKRSMLKGDAHIQGDFLAIIAKLHATKISLIANGPALIQPVVTIKALIADYHPVTRRDGIDLAASQMDSEFPSIN